MSKYEIIDARMANNPKAKTGDIVYSSSRADYGLAGYDSRVTGIEHVSVTYNTDGDYPFFTIPKAALKELP